MKRFLILIVTLSVFAGLILALGCMSPAAKAQKMFNDGQFEQVIAQYGGDPAMSAIVTQAKEKVAEKMLADSKYEAVIQMYPETAAAKEAKNKLAEQLFTSGHYTEVIAKYGDTPWAIQAKTKMDSIAAALQAAKGGKQAAASAAKEKAAQTELNSIMKIKMKDLRTKALNGFVAKPEYAGTKAVAKAHKELGH